MGANWNKSEAGKRYFREYQKRPENAARRRELERGSYGRHAARKRAYNNAWLRRDPSKRMFHAAKVRAKKLGIEFTITPADIIIPERCPALGIPLVVSSGGPNDGSPSLDRLRPERGYVPGNVFVISHLANRIKNKSTPEQLTAVAAWVKRVSRD